jgi:hypothetical protein
MPCRQLAPATPAIAFSGAPVAFFYHAAVGLIELVEKPPMLEPSPEDLARFERLET